MSNHDLISALTALPERELVGVIAGALEKRDSEVGQPDRADARPGFSDARRFVEAQPATSPWEQRAAARRQAAVAKGAGPTEQGCCGLTFTSHAKRIICPLCGKAASAS